MASLSSKFLGLYGGVVCGSTLDHINVAVAEVTAGPRLALKTFSAQPLTAEESDDLQALAAGKAAPDKLARMHAKVGALAADAWGDVWNGAGLPPDKLRAVGFRGYLLRVLEGGGRAAHLEIGSPADLALRAWRPVAGDFAAADLAVGGRGEPLAAAFHRDHFRRKGTGVAVHDIGAVAALTQISPGGECLQSIETGPGTVLIDALMRAHFQEPFDRDGARADAGQINDVFLEELAADPFFAQKSPRRDAREYFCGAFLKYFQKRAHWWGLSPADQVATATALSVRTMAEAYRRFVIPAGRIDEVILCGGGARNHTLRRWLVRELTGISVVPVDDHGIPAPGVDAVATAYLAFLRSAALPGNVSVATGAREEVVLGSLTDLRPAGKG